MEGQVSLLKVPCSFIVKHKWKSIFDRVVSEKSHKMNASQQAMDLLHNVILLDSAIFFYERLT